MTDSTKTSQDETIGSAQIKPPAKKSRLPALLAILIVGAMIVLPLGFFSEHLGPVMDTLSSGFKKASDSTTAMINTIAKRFNGPGQTEHPDKLDKKDSVKTKLASAKENLKNALSPKGNLLLPAKFVTANQVQVLDGASQELSQRIAKNPDDVSLYNRLGLIFAQLGDYDQAQPTFQKAVSVARENLKKLSQAVAQTKSSGDTAGARKALLEQSQNSIELSAAHSSLARIYEKLGQQDKVVSELNALNQDVAMGPAGDIDQQTPLTYVRTPPPKLNEKALKAIAEGQACMQQGRYTMAIKCFRVAAQEAPRAAYPHKQIGIAQSKSGNARGAVNEFLEAARLDPTNADTHKKLGLLYLGLDQPVDARNELESALALNPSDSETSLNLGNLYASVGQYELAKSAIEKAIHVTPTSAVAHNNLAAVYSLSGDYGEAISEFQEALSFDPNLASSHYGLGLALMQTNQFQASIQELKQAVLLNPSLTDANAKIELAYRKAGYAAASAAPLN